MQVAIPSPSVSYIDIPFGAINLRVHFYALCILAGIVLAILLTGRRLTRQGAPVGVVWDFAICIVPLGIVGARAYHVLTHPADYFYPGADLWQVIAIWNGGNAIFGALMGGAVGVWLASRWTGIRFVTFADALVPGLLVAQAVGRLGNYFNQELFGLPTDLPWGLEIAPGNPAIPVGLPSGVLFHPTFLYEMVWNLLGAALLLVAERRYSLYWGRLLGLYLVWYGMGRAFFESIRIDPSEMFFGIRTNIWAAWLAVVIGAFLFWRQGRSHPGLPRSPFRAGREPIAEPGLHWHLTEAVTAGAQSSPPKAS